MAVLEEDLFVKIDEFEARLRTLERQNVEIAGGGVDPTGSAGGDLSGSYPDPRVIGAIGSFPAGGDITANAGGSGQARLGQKNVLGVNQGMVSFGTLNDATAYRKAAGVVAVDNYIDASLGIRIGGVALASTQLSDSVGLARLASPLFTGTPFAPTASPGTNTTQLATTAFVVTAGVNKADLASPTFTGIPAAPTASAGTSTTQIATTAFVTTADNLKASLASPAFTGIPTAPTATPGANTTQIANTAFVTNAVGGSGFQPADPTLTGLALLDSTPGLVVENGTDTFTKRTIIGTANQIVIASGDGVSGNPTISIPNTLSVVTGYQIGGVALASTHLSDTALLARLASPAFTGVPTAPTAVVGTATTQLATTAFVTGAFQPADPTLTALAALDATPGFVVETSSDVFTKRSIVGTTNQVVVVNGDGISGNTTLSLPQSIHTTATVAFNTVTLATELQLINATNTSPLLHFRDSAAGSDYLVGQQASDLVFGKEASLYTDPTAVRMVLSSGGQLRLPVLGASGGILLGGDANLYRLNPNELKTDDALWINSSTGIGINTAPTATALINLPTALTLIGSGIQWGGDAALYRSAVGRLRTDTDLQVASKFTVGVGVLATTYIPFRNSATFSDGVSATKYGMHNSMTIQAVTNDLTNTIYGFFNELKMSDTQATGNYGGSNISIGTQVVQMNNAVAPRGMGTLEGVRSTVTYSGTGPFGNAATAMGFRSLATTPDSGVWTSRYGLYVDSASVTAGGAITSQYGIRIENLGDPAVTNAYGIYIDNQTGSALNRAIYTVGGGVRFGVNNTTSRSRLGFGLDATAGSIQIAASTAADDGIYFGTDTVVYRAAANVLQTDDQFRALRALATDSAFQTLVGVNSGGLNVQAGGKLEWADAVGGAFDTVIYRAAANTLQTDDHFVVNAGTLTNPFEITNSTSVIDSLKISRTGTTPAYFRISNPQGTPFATRFMSSTDNVAWVDNMMLDTGGRVGIGGTHIAVLPAALSFFASTSAAGGINFGGDTTLYRSAPDVLKTDDRLDIADKISLYQQGSGIIQYAATHLLRHFTLIGDAQPAFRIDPNGRMEWGAGSASTYDVALSRTGINQLGLSAGHILDLGDSGGTAINTGNGTGDKITLYQDAYGIAVQSSRLVAWVSSTSAAFSIRTKSATGQKSSGLDVIAFTGTGRIDLTGTGKTAINFTDTGTSVGLTIGGDTTLYRSAANILKTDDYFQATQQGAINLGDFNTYTMGVWQAATGAISIGADASYSYIQSWGTRPLRINNQGLLTYIDTGLSVDKGLTVTSGAISFPPNSLNGDAIQDGTLPISVFGFIFGGNNLLYNSGFEAAGLVDADPLATYQPWDGWTITNGTPGLVAKPTTELRSSTTLPVATIPIKTNANWTAPGTARMGATTFTYAGMATDADGLVTLTGAVGGSGTFAAGTPITQEPQGTDANRAWGVGPNALKVTAISSGNSLLVETSVRQVVPVLAGSPYVASFYAGASVAGKTCTIQIQWFDITRTPLAGGNQYTIGIGPNGSKVLPSTGITRLWVRAIAPVGAVYAGISGLIPSTSVTAGNIFYFDSLMLSDGDTLYSYEPRPDENLPGSINATMIQAGAINADSIVANFLLQGKRIQTNNSPNARVMLEGDPTSQAGDRGVAVFDSANKLRVLLGETQGMVLYGPGGITDPVLKLAATGGLMVGSPTSARTIFDSAGVQVYDTVPTLRIRIRNPEGLEMFDTASNLQVKLSGTGGLQTVGSGGSVFFDSTGLTGYNSTTTWTTATQVVKIDRNTGTFIAGPPSAASRVEIDRTSMRWYETDGVTVGLYALSGKLSTSNVTNVARVEMDGVLNAFSIYSATQKRVQLDGTQGLTLYDTSGVAKLFASAAGGLTTVAADTNQRVTLNSAGLLSYDATNAQTVLIDAVTGKFVLGNPTGARMEGDRTSLRFFDSTPTQQFSIINGVLTSGTLGTGARVQLNSAGILGYDSGGLQTTAIDSATGKLILGAPTGATRVEVDRTSMRFYESGGVNIGLTATAGRLSTSNAGTGARVEVDGVGDQFAVYSATQPRVILDGTTGLKLYDTGGVVRIALSTTGGLETTGTGGRVKLDDSGIYAWASTSVFDTTTQTFMLDRATGALTLGKGGTASRLVADRTSLRFYDDSNVQQFSIINGVLTTGTADSGQRVRLDSAGLKAYNSIGTNTVAINSDGSAYFRGQIDVSNSTYLGTVPAGTIITPGTIQTGLLSLVMGGGNLQPNSSFENSTTFNTGWSASGTPSLETTTVHSGTQALRLTATTTGGYIYTITAPVTEGKQFIGSAWIYSPLSRTMRMSIYGYDATKTTNIGSVSLNTVIPANVWTRVFTPVFTMPALAEWARLTIQDTTMVAGDYFIVDDTQVEEGDVWTAYSPHPSEIPPGSRLESNQNNNLSKVMIDASGFRGYDATGLVVELTNTGVLTLGPTSGASKVVVDRTSMRFYENSGTVIGLTAQSGKISTSNTFTGARVEMDGTADKFSVYSATQERVTLEGAQGLTLRDTSGVAKVFLSALGGLTTVAADTNQRVTLNGLGILAYDTGGLQTFKIDSATGLVTLGQPSPARRMEADRTSLRFYNDSNAQIFSIINGVLTTGSTGTGARTTLESAGIAGYDVSGVQRVLIDSATGLLALKDNAAATKLTMSAAGGIKTVGASGTIILDDTGITGFSSATVWDSTTQVVKFDRAGGGKLVIGPPSGAARIEADRTSLIFYQSNGTTAGLTATVGKLVSNISGSAARIEFDGIANQFAAYDTVRQRLGIDGTNGLRIWDAAGALGLQSSAGGLVTGVGTNRAEFLVSGLTLYSSNVRSVSLDAASGKLVAGTSLTGGPRVELDAAGMRHYNASNALQTIIAATITGAVNPLVMDSAGLQLFSFDNQRFLFADTINKSLTIGKEGAEHIEIDDSLRFYDATNALGLHSYAGGLFAGDGLAVFPTDIPSSGVYLGGAGVQGYDGANIAMQIGPGVESSFRGRINAAFGAELPAGADGIAAREQRVSWLTSANEEVGYLAATTEPGAGTYHTVVLANTYLKSFWRMDTAAGTNIDDIKQGGALGDLTLSGAYTLAGASLIANDVTNASITFTGGKATGTQIQNTTTADFSIICWVNPTTVDATWRVIQESVDNSTTPTKGYRLMHSTAGIRLQIWGKHTGFVGGGGSDPATVSMTYVTPLVANTTTHLAISHQAHKVGAATRSSPGSIISETLSFTKIYKNGALVYTSPTGAASGPSGPDYAHHQFSGVGITFGSQSNNANPFLGRIDEVSWYPGVVLSTSPGATYQAGVTVNPPRSQVVVGTHTPGAAPGTWSERIIYDDSGHSEIGVPTGTLITSAAPVAPVGYLLCDGSAVSRTTYAGLWAVLSAVGGSSPYGNGDGSTTFALPDLRGRVPVGEDATAGRMASNDAQGNAGGAERVTLTGPQSGIAVHNHGVTDPSHAHQVQANSGSYQGTGGTYASGTAANSGTVVGNTQGANTGISIQNKADTTALQSHENMPPFQVVKYYIKY